ncbi:conserved hypothetical protein [Leishmania mexicana MHOM/GT/2001/U1103]|uniref:C3H1-type domain-containing protein n=1 Tax=Leishmania mexicana (strain MHOM/GT/2001/U1103) TaxID=929439 RepID=E9AVQ8_LEIMU|nr:conserved hypothetical protein [Leishmania mexicana MHOM/GT/2001/U1103]CBZ27041.1 conserved hypothetical protein [Leishmania mexicana MHOM/GT/2001/U1103]
MPRTAPAKGRHISYNADGELCMTVVDPVTRKLLIPTQYIFETRAQQRGTLPSLCQLFLSGRCRKGQGCYQLHADWEAVQRLRSQVDSLPCCCPTHGDKDHIGVLENALLRESISLGHPHSHHHGNNEQNSADAAAAAESSVGANDVVLYVPGCSFFEGSYAPLDRVSYTVGLRRLLEEQRVVIAPSAARISLLNQATGFPEEKIVADASAATVCRLHAMGRCRYAEECKFLHLCKDLTTADPQLTASPATGSVNGNADCAAPGSFEASTTSAGLTNGAEPSSTACDRRVKNSHYHGGSGASGTPGAPVRQSVFTSISLQQQQQQLSLGNGGAMAADPAGVATMVKVGSASSLQPSHSMSYHQDPSMMVPTDGGAGSPHGSSRPYLMGSAGAAESGRLLVPQREDVSNGTEGAGAASAVPYLSKSFSGYRIGAVGAASQPQRPLQSETGVMPHMMNASMGSFPGSGQQNNSSPLASPYGFSAAKSNRVRVSLSLPASSPTSALTYGAALGTSNCSDKTNSPPAEGSMGMSSSHNSFSRSVTQIQASSNPTRWHHNPYLASWPKTEAPYGFAGKCNSLRCHPAGFYVPPIARAA